MTGAGFTGNRWVIAACLAALLVLSWSGALDRSARDQTNAALERALIAFAGARALNAVISVAQGTEIALQPAGVGLTLSAGEILDPLNDLIERFSWLVLIAATSLGAQVLLTEIFAQTWANVFITAAAVAYCAILWWKPYEPLAARTMLRKIVVATLFFRFFVVVVTLASSWAGNHFLSERQDLAIDTVATTTENIEAPRVEDDETWFDQIRQAVDIQAQLASLEQRVDVAISFLVDLIVTFVVQTIVFPLGAAAFAAGSIRAVWRRL